MVEIVNYGFIDHAIIHTTALISLYAVITCYFFYSIEDVKRSRQSIFNDVGYEINKCLLPSIL